MAFSVARMVVPVDALKYRDFRPIVVAVDIITRTKPIIPSVCEAIELSKDLSSKPLALTTRRRQLVRLVAEKTHSSGYLFATNRLRSLSNN